jgi:hypothetical protein
LSRLDRQLVVILKITQKDDITVTLAGDHRT